MVLDETDPFQPTQVIVTGVEMSAVMPGCCVDQGVSKVQTEVETIVGSLEAEGLVYSYDCCLAKNCNSFQCFLFALCPLDSLVGLVHNNY